MQIDIEKILLEWSYRCDKGYPDMKNVKDMSILQEIFNEMGIETPFQENILANEDIINEAPPTAAKKAQDILLTKFPSVLINEIKKSGKIDMFIQFVNTLPGGEASNVIIDKLEKIITNKQHLTELVKIFKSIKSISKLTSIDPSSGIYAELYKIQPKGIGPGEILIGWCTEGVIIQGGNVSYDIDFNGQHWEVKSLINPDKNTPESIDPAKYGKISNWKLTKSWQNFFENILGPYYEHGLRDDILSLTESQSVKTKLTTVLDTLETIPRTTSDGSTNLEVAGEITPGIFNVFYNAIVTINSLLPKSVKDATTSSRISVKSNSIDAQYWIDPKDVNNIAKNAGKGKEVTVKVGKQITNENKEGKIWLSNLMNNVFIRNPKYFINSLKEIRDGFMTGKDGLIYLTKGKIHVSKGMEDFFTSNITRSTYRFSLKSLNKFQNYTYQKEQ